MRKKRKPTRRQSRRQTEAARRNFTIGRFCGLVVNARTTIRQNKEYMTPADMAQAEYVLKYLEDIRNSLQRRWYTGK